MPEHRAEERHRQHREAHRGRQGEEDGEPEPPVDQPGELGWLSSRAVLHERWQDDGAECDAKQGSRKLHEPVRVGEPGHRAIAKPRGPLRIDDQADLRDGNADGGAVAGGNKSDTLAVGRPRGRFLNLQIALALYKNDCVAQ